MTDLRFTAMPSDIAAAYRNGSHDANGQPPERHISDGNGVPCRHCLANVTAGDGYLILAHRPFPAPQPYAEIGPIFLHTEDCPRHDPAAGLPAMYEAGRSLIMRGYNRDDRIIYGTGQVIKVAELEERAARLLERDDVAYIHMRSSTNNCYQFRIDRG